MDIFDTFEGTQPNLISKTTIKELEDTLGLNNNIDNERMLNGIGSFYDNYIAPNLFPIIVICLLILYLTIKYVIKRDKDEQNKKIRMARHKKQEVKQEVKQIEMIKNNTDDDNTSSTPDISNMISEDYLLTESELKN